MYNKNLKLEITNLLKSVEDVFGKDSIPFDKMENYLEILKTNYEKNFDSDKDTLLEFKAHLTKLAKKIPELQIQQFKEKYPNLNSMIEYLDEWLTD